MFWRMTGLSTPSPVESILDKEDYTLEELLDEDEIIQECKALNSRLINFLRETTQVEQLVRYIVEEAPKDAEKKRTFKFPYIACEIFTCEVDVILRTLVENEELMDLLFSFLKLDVSYSTLLAGYFSKVVVCLMLRKTVSFMNYVQGHQEIIHQLVDLIGITSIMEVLIRLIGADEHLYSSYMDATLWLEDMNVLEMIVDKFSSSDSPEVHANAAEVLCAITRYAPPGLATKISSPSFVGRLFHHALKESRPKSVLVHSLTICISLLDPKRLVPASYSFRSQLAHGSSVMANPETVDSMLESLGDLLKLLDNSSNESILPTTYGSLHPPLGKHRLKIVEFVSVLLTIGNVNAEKELIHLGALHRILALFFEYPFNNFLHHHVENIVVSCLESKQSLLTKHLLHDCNLVDKILDAERNSTCSSELNKPTVSAEGRSPPRIGNFGHMTRLANNLIQLGITSSMIESYLQGNSEWVDWNTNVLLKRNAMENVYQWVCGRPTESQDRTRDSDDEELRDRDDDIPAPLQDVYFGAESAELMSSLYLGDDQDSSLITNSNWFAFDGNDQFVNEQSTSLFVSLPTSTEETDEVVLDESDELHDTTVSYQLPEPVADSEEPENLVLLNGPTKLEVTHLSMDNEFEKPPEWVERRETSDKIDLPGSLANLSVPNGDHDKSNHIIIEKVATSSMESLHSAANLEDESRKRWALPGSVDHQGCSPEHSITPTGYPPVLETSESDMHIEPCSMINVGTVGIQEKTKATLVENEA